MRTGIPMSDDEWEPDVDSDPEGGIFIVQPIWPEQERNREEYPDLMHDPSECENCAREAGLT